MVSAGRSAVTQVITPDTIGLRDGRILHLSGVEFPDLHQPDGPGPLAQTAKRVVTDLLLGHDVRLYQTQDKTLGRVNRMEHIIAQLERADGEVWVQGTLLVLGLARMKTGLRNRDMAGQMRLLEDFARQNKDGLWALSGYSILRAKSSPKNSINHYGVVEGTVRNVSTTKTNTYINFGEDWKTDFTIVLPSSSRRAFVKSGIDPLQWNTRTLRVRGWLEFHNGPSIEIDHPEQVEVLDENP